MLVVVGSSSRLNPRLNALAAVGSVSVDTASTDGGSTALILGAVGISIAFLAGSVPSSGKSCYGRPPE